MSKGKGLKSSPLPSTSCVMVSVAMLQAARLCKNRIQMETIAASLHPLVAALLPRSACCRDSKTSANTARVRRGTYRGHGSEDDGFTPRFCSNRSCREEEVNTGESKYKCTESKYRCTESKYRCTESKYKCTETNVLRVSIHVLRVSTGVMRVSTGVLRARGNDICAKSYYNCFPDCVT